MVTRRFLASTLGASLSLGLGACNFSEFDDLAEEAWVDRVESPSATSSRQYGEALVATPLREAGTNVVVLGKFRASLSLLQYDDEGVRQPITAVDPRPTLSFSTFSDNPALAADRDSERIAFAVVQGDNIDPTRVAVYDGRDISSPFKSVILSEQLLVGGQRLHNINAGGITFTDLPGFGEDTEDEIALTRGPQVALIQDYAVSEADTDTTYAVKGCLHGDDDDWGFGVAIADVLPDDEHAGPEIVVGTGAQLRTGSSRVLIIDPASVTPESGACTILETISSTEDPGDLGAVVTQAQFPDVADEAPGAELDDLIYSAPTINKVFVRFGGGGGVEINPGEDGADFGDSIATGDLDSDGIPELIIGAPRSDPDGVTNGGSVYVYKFRSTPSLGFDLVETLHPGEPVNEERYGKSVAVAPFGTGDRNVLVVGAEGEVFTYFRTSLYSDVRAGRTP